MRKILRGVLALLLLALLPGASALAEDGAAYQVVACPEQGFTTACETGLRWRWDDVNGIVIHTGHTGGAPCLMIRVTGSGGRDFEGYFNDVLTPQLQEALGDDLLAVSPFDSYALGAQLELPGVMYTYLDAEGQRQVLFRLFDTRWATNVCYTLRYGESDSDATLRALGIALEHYQPDGDAPAMAPATAPDTALQPAPCSIDCPWQGYRAVCDVDCATLWTPADGLYVYLDQWGVPPYVLISAAQGDVDIPAFFRDAVTPAMRGRYGADLLEEIDCGNITIGQRVMAGFGYRYRLGGDVIYMLRVLENRDGRNVSYITKFPEDDDTARLTAMKALASIADSLELDRQ